MSHKTGFALLATLTILLTASSPDSTCVFAPLGEVIGLVTNGVQTHVGVSNSTIYPNQSVTFTATVTPDDPDETYNAGDYEWYVDGEYRSFTEEPYFTTSFDAPGTYYIEVMPTGYLSSENPDGTTNHGIGAFTDAAGMYVTVLDPADCSDDCHDD